MVVVVVALELVPLSKRMFGSDTPQGYTRQLRHASSSNHVPIRDAIDGAKLGLLLKESGPRLWVRRALDQESRHEAWAHGLASLEPYPVQKVRARVHTIGPRSKAQWAWGSRIVRYFIYNRERERERERERFH